MMMISKSPKHSLIISGLLVLLSACSFETTYSESYKAAPMTAPPSIDVIVEIGGQRSNYVLTKSSKEFQVKNIQTNQTSVHPLSTTIFKFTDIKLNTNMLALSDSIPSSDLKLLVELYIAFFNRVPDAEGLAYWIDEKRMGKSIPEIADIFFQAALVYSEQTGYTKDMSNADFVKIIYKNVLGRSGASAPPDADVNYWANELATNKTTKGGLIIAMLNSAHSFTNHPQFGWVEQLLENKYAVAVDFAIVNGITYSTGKESLSKTMSIAATITPADSSQSKSIFKQIGMEANSNLIPQIVGEPRFSKGNPSVLEISFDRDMTDDYATEGSYLVQKSGWRSDKRTFYMEITNYTPNSSMRFLSVDASGKIGFQSADRVPLKENIVFYFPKDASQLLNEPAVSGPVKFITGANPKLEIFFDSEMSSSYAVEGQFKAKSMYWKSDKRTFVIELLSYISDGQVFFNGKNSDGNAGFQTSNKIPMKTLFMYKLPKSDSGEPNPNLTSKIISGPTFTIGSTPKISISFDRTMGPGFDVKGEYVPTSSYWLADKKTFVIEFAQYTPGGTIQFIGGSNSGFRSIFGEPLAETVVFTFPKN
jgi:hypothetical protein